MYATQLPIKPRLLLATLALLLAGCLEREETIRVDRRGAVHMDVEISGDPGDFATGDALPTEATGWKVQDRIETDDEGEQTQHRRATCDFRPGEPLADSYAEPGDPQYGVALMFPTTLTIERRRDGTYYHFQRIYESRAQARYSIHQELLKEELDAIQQFGEEDPEELTEQQRRQVIGVLRTLEALKQAEYLAAGAAALQEEWPQDYRLVLRSALLDHFTSADVTEVVELLGEPQSPERDQAINAFGTELIESARDVLQRQMKKLRVPAGQVELFFAAYDEEQARRAVTEDIEDESWEVRIELPGEIIAHNGTSVDGPFIVWTFPGKAIFDRDHVLMVTSRVSRHQPRRDTDTTKHEDAD